jgi:hypothetical protein
VFAKNLSTAQKKVMISLAYRIMVADYKLRIEESELVSALEHELGIGDELTDEEMRTEPDLSLLTDRECRVGVMLKLYAIAHADAELHQAEFTKLRDWGTRMGFDAATLDRMDAWGRTHYILVREATALARDQGTVVAVDMAARVADL